jgi:hypothetical protein
MKPIQLVLIIPLVVASLLTGCARQRFGYPLPASAAPNPTGKAAEILAISDVRTNRQIDEALVTNYLSQVAEVLTAELQSMGHLRSVFVQGTNSIRADLLVRTEMQRLEWEVPNYNTIIGITFFASLLTGGIGGIIYGSTSTDVNGMAVVRFEISDINPQRVIMSREFTGRHKERVSKLNCDSNETKARVASLAFRDAVEQLKAELRRVLPPPAQARASSRHLEWVGHGPPGRPRPRSADGSF